MSFRLVSSAGNVSDPAVVNLAASGTIWPGGAVDFVPGGGTGGAVVAASDSTSTGTMVLGVAQTYVQGASSTGADVILFAEGQLWEVDCANAATTAQVGLRHALSALAGNKARYVHNTATDISTATGIFLALAMTGSTSGSGKLIGVFNHYNGKLVPVNSTTFLQ